MIPDDHHRPVSGNEAGELDTETWQRLIVDLRDEEPAMVSIGLRSVPFVDLTREYSQLQDEIDAAIQSVLHRGDFVLGEAVDTLERAFADYCGAAHGVGVDSGFSALELILRAHDLGPGDEVIAPANTFVATVAAIVACGARPVLVDIDPDTYNLDPGAVEQAVTPATRAILPVHLYGQPARMDEITEIARRHGLWVFEDACQAHGAWHRGQRAGSLGDAAAFSFYPSKNLGAYGDGGMVVTDDPMVAERIRLLRNLGSMVKNHHEIRGYNHRLDTLQAAVLGVKLRHLDEANASRRRTAELYGELLRDLPVVTPLPADGVDHVYHLYVVRVPDRNDLQRHLEEANVATGIHYPVPVHLQPAFRELGEGPGSFPEAEAAADQILSLPIYPHMPLAQVAYVGQSIRSFYGG